ncbi:MAG: TerB family tellurite resistance protein [Bacteroidia bacterium]|nr:TerB family tellurite resistance protein [Bacteroidia bacterium]MDW8158876.1 TerB family tellurite resistance protein [Bacteroidia bacterium]
MSRQKTDAKKDALEIICLFLGYIMVADGNVDIQESIILNTFITVNGLDPSLKNELIKIFTHDKDRVALITVLEKLREHPTEVQEQALIAGLIMAYGDGDYHEQEDNIFKLFLEITNFDSSRFATLRASVSVQPSIKVNAAGSDDL